MTHFNNWGEIPEELQLEICKQFWERTETFEALNKAANGELFPWAISQGLINKPEPVEGWFVPNTATTAIHYGRNHEHATPLIKNPDGTYSEVKDDVEPKPFDLTACCKEQTALKALGE